MNKRALLKRMFRRPFRAARNTIGFKKSDPEWLKWTKRAATVAVAVASAVAACTGTILIVTVLS